MSSGPVFWFFRDNNAELLYGAFLIADCKYMVPGKPYSASVGFQICGDKDQNRIEQNNWDGPDVNEAEVGPLLLNTRIIFCSETYLL